MIETLKHLFEEPVGIFLVLTVIVLVAPMLSRLIRLPDLIGLIFAGWLVGPYGLALLERESIEVFATVGLIYLMFTAGVEVDLEQFRQVRYKSIGYGLVKFIVPQVIGIGVGLLLGYEFLSAALLGSIFVAHTLVAFPIASRLGITRSPIIAVTVGSTIIADILALLVVALVSGAASGNMTPLDFARLLALLAGYTALVLIGVPRLGRFFFRRFSASAIEFQFVIVVIFVAAFLAELIGMEAIVGAFLAGLAINATLPHRSTVITRVLFVGESLFIPVFLLSIGMLLNLGSFLSDIQALLTGIMLVVTIFGAKYLATWLFARWSGYSFTDTIIMWGMSHAEAAAALAVVLVGIELGLLDTLIFNSVILVILVSCITSPLLVERFGRKLAEAQDETDATGLVPRIGLFSRILIPVANPSTETYLIGLAAILARSNEGTLLPLNVARAIDTRVLGLDKQRQLLESPILHSIETKVEPIARIDESIATGILYAALEHQASLILLGWSGKPTVQESVLGRMLDEVVWDAHVPVLVSRITTPINSKKRIVVVIQPGSITASLVPDIVHLAVTIASSINVSLLFYAHEHYLDDIAAVKTQYDREFELQAIDYASSRELAKRIRIDDLVIVTTAGTRQWFESSLGKFPEELADSISASMIVVRFPH